MLREEGAGRPDTAAHQRNFLDCVKSGGEPNASIETGHRSAALCHLGNIAVRTGRVLRFDPTTEKILGDRKAGALVTRRYRPGHWAAPSGVSKSVGLLTY